MAGVHFTGSNATFNSLWKQVSANLQLYRSYPRIVGETGGKDFIFAHNSQIRLLLQQQLSGVRLNTRVRSALQHQEHISRSRSGKRHQQHLLKMVSEIRIGDVTDLNNFVNAVIDEPSFDRIMSYIDLAKASSRVKVITGGGRR